MKKILRFLAVTVLSMGMIAMSAVVPMKADAAVSSWQKGASIAPHSQTDFASDSFKQSVRNLKATGANYVTLIVPYYQSNPGSTDLAAGWNTPDSASLTAGINYVHSQGMKVMLKPHVDLYDGQWRAMINPGDRNTWYSKYAGILNNLATVGAAAGVEQISVGSELISMSTYTSNGDNTQRWQSLIAGVRSRYNGSLTYSSNWGGEGFANEKEHIAFWPQLDYIGISAYFNLNADNTVASIKNAWDGYNFSQIKTLSDKFGKPILFTEIGYRSVNGARFQPWNYSNGGGYSAQEQVNLYQALFEYWNNYSYMAGIHLWNWDSNPNAGGSGNTEYTPQNKPAEGTIKQWFSNGSTPDTGTSTGTTTNPGNTGNTSVSGTFSASGTVTPTTPAINQAATLAPTVTIAGTASNVIVDVEVYNSANAKVFQKFYENESFTSNQSKNYSTTWTPTTAGTYKLVVGVFNNNWTKNYLWSEVKTFTVSQTGGGTGTTTPPDGGSNNASFGGTATIVPASPATNQSATLHGTASAKGTVSNAIVDFEIYQGSNRVFQQYFENQNLSSSSRNYDFSWTPAQTGSYTVKMGIFSSGWSTNYMWNDNVLTFTVGQGSGGNTGGTTTPPTGTTTPPTNPPPSGSYSTNIWWPTNGATVGGVTPFKAMLEGLDVSQYKMFWQVDSGTLNEMFNSNQDYPHKEALVDVSGWSWKGAGPYTINFLSQSMNGSTISQKSVNINVAR